jgi:hypothetical protein
VKPVNRGAELSVFMSRGTRDWGRRQDAIPEGSLLP